jgi:hypothetical protein
MLAGTPLQARIRMVARALLTASFLVSLTSSRNRFSSTYQHYSAYVLTEVVNKDLQIKKTKTKTPRFQNITQSYNHELRLPYVIETS